MENSAGTSHHCTRALERSVLDWCPHRKSDCNRETGSIMDAGIGLTYCTIGKARSFVTIYNTTITTAAFIVLDF